MLKIEYVNHSKVASIEIEYKSSKYIEKLITQFVIVYCEITLQKSRGAVFYGNYYYKGHCLRWASMEIEQLNKLDIKSWEKITNFHISWGTVF